MPGGLQRSANQKHQDPFKVDRYVLCRFQSRLDVKADQTDGTVQIVVNMTNMVRKATVLLLKQKYPWSFSTPGINLVYYDFLRGFILQ